EGRSRCVAWGANIHMTRPARFMEDETGRPRPNGSGSRGPCRHPEFQTVAIRCHIHLDLVALRELAEQDLLRQRVFDVALDRSLQRTCTVRFVITVLHEKLRGRHREAEREL